MEGDFFSFQFFFLFFSRSEALRSVSFSTEVETVDIVDTVKH